MAIKTTGPLGFSEVNQEILQRERQQISFGNSPRVRDIVRQSVPNNPAGYPGNRISFLDLYATSLKTPLPRDLITTSTNYTTLHPDAELVEFWVVGGGGGGGSAGANDPIWNSGVAAAGGGGAGGTGYGRISGAAFAANGPWIITIGAGGTATAVGQRGRVGGGAGGRTSFLGPVGQVNGYGYGGGGGGAASYWSPGNDVASAPGGGGGSGDGRGVGYSDITGGAGGSAYVSSRSLTWSAGGGGCISMDRKRVTSYDGQSVSSRDQYGAGAKGINTAVPTSLASYRNNLTPLWENISPVVFGGNGGSPTGGNGSLGGGGGGGVARSARGGNGGAGFVYIIYTPAAEMISYDNSNGGPYSRPSY
jgi:hypothetical protein